MVDQVRTELGTPLPKVYAWDSRLENNQVGAEYIIMEKVRGIELEQVWHNLLLRERFKIVKTIASCQKAWCSTSFQ